MGLALGQGKRLAEILEDMNQVAEGVRTTYGACALAEQHGVEMPIAFLMRELLEGKLSVERVPELIMTRQLRSETE